MTNDVSGMPNMIYLITICDLDVLKEQSRPLEKQESSL